ncbi:unnamed protein product [Ixodes persulcatus]
MLHNLLTGDNSTRVRSPNRRNMSQTPLSLREKKNKKRMEARWFSAGSRRRKLRTVGKTTPRSCEASTVEARAAVAALCDVDCGEKGMAPLVWLTVLSGSLCNFYTLPGF